MALVEPFRALRYDPQRVDVSRVVAPPLDFVDERKRAALLEREPRNVVSLLAHDALRSVDENRARHALFTAELRRAGILVRDDAPAIYVVRETVRSATADGAPTWRVGFFARVTQTESGRVLPHEETLDRPRDVGRDVKEPLLLAFDDPGGRVMRTLRAETAERDPDLRAAAFGETVELFVVDDETACARVTALLEERELLIADGHHRFRALAGRPFLAFLTVQDDPANHLDALHRVIDIDGFRRDFFLDSAGAFFAYDELAFDADVRGLLDHAHAPRAILVDRRGFVALTLRNDAPLDRVCDPSDLARRRVPTALLSSIVLSHLLAVDEASVRYVAHTDAAIDWVARADHGTRIALLLPRPSFKDVVDVAREGRLVPAKTTSFVPKVMSGLVVAAT